MGQRNNSREGSEINYGAPARVLPDAGGYVYGAEGRGEVDEVQICRSPEELGKGAY